MTIICIHLECHLAKVFLKQTGLPVLDCEHRVSFASSAFAWSLSGFNFFIQS